MQRLRMIDSRSSPTRMSHYGVTRKLPLLPTRQQSEFIGFRQYCLVRADWDVADLQGGPKNGTIFWYALSSSKY